MLFESLEQKKIPGLTKEQFAPVVEAVQQALVSRGADFYAWQNPPELSEGGDVLTQKQGYGEMEKEVPIEVGEALDIYKRKLDSAYSERFVMTIAMLPRLIENGYSVRLVQFQEEHGAPFDASGWLVVVVESMPLFHISPEDMSIDVLRNIVELLPDNQAEDVSWKNTNKVGEFTAILSGVSESGLDLVHIAQSKSGEDL